MLYPADPLHPPPPTKHPPPLTSGTLAAYRLVFCVLYGRYVSCLRLYFMCIVLSNDVVLWDAFFEIISAQFMKDSWLDIDFSIITGT